MMEAIPYPLPPVVFPTAPRFSSVRIVKGMPLSAIVI